MTWTTRGAWSAHGALGSMPIGTGRTGANVWVDDEGLRVLISATDSYSELSQLMKIGMVHVQLDPNPFAPLPAPPPGPPPPPLAGNRSALRSFVESKGIGCASASGCVDPQDPTLLRFFTCSSRAACPAEAAAACGNWSRCTSFSISTTRLAKLMRAQLFACAKTDPTGRPDPNWNSWRLRGSTCGQPPPRTYPKFEQTLDVDKNLLTITSGGVELELFADWNNDVIRGRVTSAAAAAAAGSRPLRARIVQRGWRNVTVADCVPGNPRCAAPCSAPRSSPLLTSARAAGIPRARPARSARESTACRRPW